MFSKLALSGLLVLSLTTVAAPARAQVTVNINPPSWGPAAPAGTQYYYVPEYGGYYDLRAQRYLVQRDGRWLRLVSLSGYNPASFHPVVIDYRGASPWVRVEEHRSRYGYKGHPHGMPPGQAKKLRGAAPGRPGGVIVVAPGGRYHDHDHDHRGRGRGHGGHPGKGHGRGKH